jgi:hypothetical protein
MQRKNLNSEAREFLDTSIKKKAIFSCSLSMSIRPYHMLNREIRHSTFENGHPDQM